MQTLADGDVHKSTFLDIPLLSFDRSSVVGKTTLSHWEENLRPDLLTGDYCHYISVDDGPCSLGQIFHDFSAKMALDKVRESFEKEGLLIAVEGSLVYAVYTNMCHDMGGGYKGYNGKNGPDEITIKNMVCTFNIVDPNAYLFVSSLADQKEYMGAIDSNPRHKIIRPWHKILEQRE